jgi:hypothetical protein
LPDVVVIVTDLERATIEQGFRGLPISLRHGQVAGALPGPHRDPFDRVLIAQAILENLALVSENFPGSTFIVRDVKLVMSSVTRRLEPQLRWVLEALTHPTKLQSVTVSVAWY